jgi:hypothetical protein
MRVHMCGECEMQGRTGTGAHGNTNEGPHCSCWFDGHAAGMEAAARIAEEHQDHWDTGVPIQNHMPEPGDPPRCCVADAIRAAKPKP